MIEGNPQTVGSRWSKNIWVIWWRVEQAISTRCYKWLGLVHLAKTYSITNHKCETDGHISKDYEAFPNCTLCSRKDGVGGIRITGEVFMANVSDSSTIKVAWCNSLSYTRNNQLVTCKENNDKSSPKRCSRKIPSRLTVSISRRLFNIQINYLQNSEIAIMWTAFFQGGKLYQRLREKPERCATRVIYPKKDERWTNPMSMLWIHLLRRNCEKYIKWSG